jgi:peptidyl-prolyl cis-trans isomerase D
MLKSMRESFHHLRWILLAVVAAFVFGFVFIDMGLGGALGGAAPDAAFAARVNGETITFNDFGRALKNVSDMYKQSYGQQFTPEMAEAMGLNQQVLQTLIDQRLLAQEAKRVNLSATPEEVRKRLLTLPGFSENGKFIGMELYRNYVTGALGYPSASAFESDIAREIALEKMESALQSSVVVAPKTAEAEYRRLNENAEIRFVMLPAAQAAASVAVTPAEVEKYYNDNRSRYTHGEQRQIRYLMADYAKLRATLNPSEAELRKRYEANKDRFGQPAAARVQHILVKADPAATPQVEQAAREKAESIVAQLRGGADFAMLARQHSEDPSSSGQGGAMGWVEMGQTVEPFERAIFSIPLNTISDPIKTQEYGYHIVRVTERRAEQVQPFEAVRAQIRTQLVNEMARDVATAEMNRINAQIREQKPGSVDEFVSMANEKVTSNDSGWFGRNESIEGIGFNQPLSEWVFDSEPGSISERPVGSPRGILIAYIAGTRPAGIPALSEIREKVENDVRQAKAREAARQQLAAQMAGAASIDEVAQKSGRPVSESPVSRQRQVTGISGDATALIDAVFAANAGELRGPVIAGDGAVAFQVVEMKKVTPEELAQNRKSFMNDLRMQEARTLRASLIARLRKEAQIEVNDEITRPTTAPPAAPAGI